MVETIKKQFRLQADMLGWAAGLTAGAVVFGSVLYYVADRLVSKENTYIPLGTAIGMVILGIYLVIGMISTMLLNFQIEISMGCTRKQFFVSYYLVMLVYGLLSAGVLILLNLAENAVGQGLYEAVEPGAIVGGYLLRYAAPVVAVIVAVSGLCGAFLMRFGKTAGWVIYAAWMFLLLGGPRITDAMTEAPDSVFGRFGLAVRELVWSVPVGGWIAAGVLAVVACIAGAYALVSRQQVA